MTTDARTSPEQNPEVAPDAQDLVATSSQTVGPFFSFGLCTNQELCRIASSDAPGEHIRLTVRLLDGAGDPVPDAMIELSQSDAQGGRNESGSFRGFGRAGTNAQGECTFETVRPGQPQGAADVPHINICLFMRGLLRQIYTRVYFEDEPGLSNDAIWQLVPEARRSTLVARRISGMSSDWLFEIHLQGEKETVFFDI
jgi:protocatechuate 3,4-dioxygenase alpha subunit